MHIYWYVYICIRILQLVKIYCCVLLSIYHTCACFSSVWYCRHYAVVSSYTQDNLIKQHIHHHSCPFYLLSFSWSLTSFIFSSSSLLTLPPAIITINTTIKDSIWSLLRCKWSRYHKLDFSYNKSYVYNACMENYIIIPRNNTKVCNLEGMQEDPVCDGISFVSCLLGHYAYISLCM